MPLRLQMAIRAEALGDADVQQFVNRDLRLLIMHPDCHWRGVPANDARQSRIP